MAKIKVSCSNCKKEYDKWPSQIPKSGLSYCSLSCSTSYRNKFEYNPSHHRDLTGENNPMYGNGHLIAGTRNGMYGRSREASPAYRGGRHQRSDGYYRVLIDGARVLEHRKVMMDLGVDIDGKVVHHKNGNKADNRIENLEVITQSQHINEHREDLNRARCI